MNQRTEKYIRLTILQYYLDAMPPSCRKYVREAVLNFMAERIKSNIDRLVWAHSFTLLSKSSLSVKRVKKLRNN